MTNNATVYNNFQLTLPLKSVYSAIRHAISQTTAPQNVNSNNAATYSNQVNPFSTANNIDPLFVTPIIPPMYGNTAPAPFFGGGPLHPTPLAPAAENANHIKALSDAITKKRNDPLPEWKLSQCKGDPLQWHEWYCQIKSAIVTVKDKTAIAEVAYYCAIYKDALRTLECKVCQPQTVISAHLDTLNSFPTLKIHNSNNINNFLGCISNLFWFLNRSHKIRI